jgi:hypothetical protein
MGPEGRVRVPEFPKSGFWAVNEQISHTVESCMTFIVATVTGEQDLMSLNLIIAMAYFAPGWVVLEGLQTCLRKGGSLRRWSRRAQVGSPLVSRGSERVHVRAAHRREFSLTEVAAAG